MEPEGETYSYPELRKYKEYVPRNREFRRLSNSAVLRWIGQRLPCLALPCVVEEAVYSHRMCSHESLKLEF
jgi:hypothetical protein